MLDSKINLEYIGKDNDYLVTLFNKGRSIWIQI